jgi:beta-lactamase regulating signal transducer with metallopeptidase domain
MNLEFDGLARVAWAQLWQVTIVAVGIGTIVSLCGRDRPRLAYALWMLVVIKAIVPPYWASPTGVFSWALADRATAEPVYAERPPVTASALHTMTHVAKSPLVANGGMEWDRLCRAVILIWAAGFVLSTAYVLAKLIVCAIVIRWSRRPVDMRQVSALAELSLRLGVKRDVRLIVTSRPIGPAVFGLLRPSILLPEALLAGNSRERVELILSHELIHFRRGDIIAGKLQLIAQLVWWFHPLVWWANREACRERERCCDGEVVSDVGCKPASYARALLSVVEQKSLLRPLVAIPGVRALDVTSRRLESIMKDAQSDYRRASLISRVVFAAGAIVIVPGMGLTLRAHPTMTDRDDGTVVTAPAKSAALTRTQDALRSPVRRGPGQRRIVSAMTLEQTSPRSEGKTTEAQGAKTRWRAQQVVTRKAEADYHNARLTREVAEIVVLEYEEGIFKQDLATIEGEIKLAESDRSRSKDRLEWARRMFVKGFIAKTVLVSEEQALKKARFTLEQAQSKKKVLVDYTKGTTIKELKSEVEKARSDELAKKATWEREKSKEKALEREAVR